MITESPKLEAGMVLDEKHLRLRRARAPLHIQVVDDDPVTTHLLSTLLGRNYHVTVSETVHEAINDYVRVAPDLVFLDISLGDTYFNGLSVLNTLQMIDWDANVVMLSAHNTAQNIAEATRKGAMGFIAKPFNKDVLLRYVKECEQSKGNACN